MSLDAVKLADEALEFNDAPAQVWMKVRDAEKLIYSRNPKRHDFGALITSLARYGYQETAKYDATLRAIKAGNGRIEALAKMERDGKYALPRGLAKHRESGEWCLPILMGTDAPSETEALAYLVDANNITMLGGDLGMHEMARMWDEDIYAGILADLQKLDSAPVSMDSDDISALLAGMETQSVGESENADADELVDRAEELNKKWKVKTGDLWELGEHRIICGDCTQADVVKKLLGDEKPNLMVTDPPYGVKYDPAWRVNIRGKLGDVKSFGKVDNDERYDWTEAWSLFEGNVAYVWCASWFVGAAQISLENCNFAMRNLIIWAKQHFSLSRGDYHWQHEPCIYAVKKDQKSNWCGDRTQSTLWQISSQNAFGGDKIQKRMLSPATARRNHSSVWRDQFEIILKSAIWFMIRFSAAARH